VRNRLLARHFAAALIVASCAGRSDAGWRIERVTRTEGAAGPTAKVVLLISKGHVKEVHEDGTYFLWDLSRRTLFQVDPAARKYSGGPIEKMIAAVKQYFDRMRADLANMTDEQREALARKSGDLPMPVPPPAKPPLWTAKRTERKETIIGRKAELYEIYRDGKLYESRWITTQVNFGGDLDYPAFARWSRELEAAFATGMGQDLPTGKAVERLDGSGLVLRSVLTGEGVRVVSEVTRIQTRDVPDSTFVLPVEYQGKGAQVSRRP
jgi:hypothetical protein